MIAGKLDITIARVYEIEAKALATLRQAMLDDLECDDDEDTVVETAEAVPVPEVVPVVDNTPPAHKLLACVNKWLWSRAHRAVYRFEFLRLSTDEWFQECALGILRKAGYYDLARGEPTLFANQVCRSVISVLIQGHDCQKRKRHRTVSYYDNTYVNSRETPFLELMDDGGENDPAPKIERQDTKAKQWQMLNGRLENLDPLNAAIIGLTYGTIDGTCYPSEMIAETLGCTRSNVAARRRLALRTIGAEEPSC